MLFCGDQDTYSPYIHRMTSENQSMQLNLNELDSLPQRSEKNTNLRVHWKQQKVLALLNSPTDILSAKSEKCIQFPKVLWRGNPKKNCVWNPPPHT